jgi:ABC-type molybdate transport system ATPase subunit
MTSATFRAAGLGQLRSADLVLAPGRYVVLSNEAEPLRDFVAVAAGRRAPSSGHVLLDGAAPAVAPDARRRIAALFADEALPPAHSMESSVERALAARADQGRSASRLLADSGLSHLAGQAPRTLGARETRSVALALALSHESASFFVLHEPLTTLLASSYVLEALDRHTARGAIVLSTTSSSADANLLGGSWLCVEFGMLRATPGVTSRLGNGPWQQLVVEAADARALSLLLHDSPLGLTTELSAPAAQLKVTGPSLDETVREIITIARERGIEITRIEPALPPVEALMAARAGFARGAYEASRAAAHDAARPAPVPYGAPR